MASPMARCCALLDAPEAKQKAARLDSSAASRSQAPLKPWPLAHLCEQGSSERLEVLTSTVIGWCRLQAACRPMQRSSRGS